MHIVDVSVGNAAVLVERERFHCGGRWTYMKPEVKTYLLVFALVVVVVES